MKIPDEIIEAIEYEIGRYELDCADNYRAYRLSDKFLKRQFLDRKNQGCCGEFECTYIDLSGEKWVIGCNYGH